MLSRPNKWRSHQIWFISHLLTLPATSGFFFVPELPSKHTPPPTGVTTTSQINLAQTPAKPTLKPTTGPYHSGLADAYAKSGQTDKAVAEWATAVQNDPANAGTYYFNEGAVLTNTGKVDEAIAAFDQALQADPTRADAYYWKGVDLMGKATVKGDKMVAPAGTAEAFNKYLELAPAGKYADPAKQMLATIGATVETSYGKGKTAPKKKP